MKMLQFCNIFTKDVSQFNRTQRHEIIKYVRGRLPIFLSQIHQILQNINSVLCSLTNDEKNDLTTYLVPEVNNFEKYTKNICTKFTDFLFLDNLCIRVNYFRDIRDQVFIGEGVQGPTIV